MLLLIYLASVINNLIVVIGILAAILLFFGLVITIANAAEGTDTTYGKKLLGWALATAVFTALLPSSNTLYLMAAVHYGEKAVVELTPELKEIKDLVMEKLRSELGTSAATLPDVSLPDVSPSEPTAALTTEPTVPSLTL